MKKTIALILASALAASATGCGKEIADSVITKADVSEVSTSESETVENSEPSSTENSKETESAADSQTESAAENEEDSNDNSGNEVAYEDYQDSDEEISAEGGGEDVSSAAQELYRQGMQISFELFCGCPYELDYSNGTSNGYYPITDPSINSVSDIYDYYGSVFADTSQLEQSGKYTDIDGTPYCRDSARGADMYYQGTDLVYVSGDDTSASFTAVSHYADPETGEAMDDKSADFSIVKQDGTWKITEFHLPK
jgi:hypothetical protein